MTSVISSQKGTKMGAIIIGVIGALLVYSFAQVFVVEVKKKAELEPDRHNEDMIKILKELNVDLNDTEQVRKVIQLYDMINRRGRK